MGIPVKGSRRVEVEGSTYRYLIRKDRPRRGPLVGPLRHKESGCRVVTVQQVNAATNKPKGQVLQALLYSKTWVGMEEDEERVDTVTLTPEEVREVVRLARIQGWEPAFSGVFMLFGVSLEHWESAS
jgi:hypothetical protein